MAEIHVQAKKQHSNTSWVWIVLILLVAATVVYFLTRNTDTTEQDNQVTPASPTSYVQPQQAFVLHA